MSPHSLKNQYNLKKVEDKKVSRSLLGTVTSGRGKGNGEGEVE
jgi:hypothetical protein